MEILKESRAHVLILMGVSGSGKSTVAQALVDRLQPMASCMDGDSFHTPEHVERMRQGIPLTDADREPWLLAQANALRVWWQTHQHASRLLILASSALKASYRDMLRVVPRGHLTFVFLAADAQLLRSRLQRRDAQGAHYMHANMLESQLATLDVPRVATEPDTMTVTLSADKSVAQVVDEICADRQAWLHAA